MSQRPAIAIADQVANLSLGLVAGLNVLFLISFLMLMAFASSEARAPFERTSSVTALTAVR